MTVNAPPLYHPPSSSIHPLLLYPSPHHDWLQEANEGAEATPLLHQGAAHRLLLCLLHQQAQVGDILHGTVHLRLQVSSPWERRQGGQGGEDVRPVWRVEVGFSCKRVDDVGKKDRGADHMSESDSGYKRLETWIWLHGLSLHQPLFPIMHCSIKPLANTMKTHCLMFWLCTCFTFYVEFILWVHHISLMSMSLIKTDSSHPLNVEHIICGTHGSHIREVFVTAIWFCPIAWCHKSIFYLYRHDMIHSVI